MLIIAGSDDVLVNQERERALLAWDHAPERLDLAEVGITKLMELLRSPSLFGETRYGVLDHLESSEEALAALERYLEGSTVELVACWRGALRAPAKKRLEALGTLVTVSVPVKKDIVARIREMARATGVSLSAEGASVLSSRLGSDWGRVESVLEQLSSASLLAPTPAMLERLCGSARADSAPWDITEAISKGDFQEALELARHVEPVVLSNWVGKETIAMARCAEEGWSGDEAAKQLGLHPYRAKKAVAWARKRGLRWGEAIARAGDLDIAAKSGDLDMLLVALASWAQSVTTP